MEEIKIDAITSSRMTKIISAMKGFAVFRNEVICRELIFSDGFSLFKYSSGELIYGKESFKRSLGIVVEGTATVKKKSGGSTVDMKSVKSGEVFGAAALFGECDEYSSEITAKGKETLVAFISQSAMRSLFERDSESAIGYITFLSGRIRYLNEKIKCFTGSDSHSKLCTYLEKNNESEISVASLARALDIGRSSLYRSLTRLTECGAIEKMGRYIKVIDRSLLK